MKLRPRLFLLLLLLPALLKAGPDSMRVYVHILHGSKPKKEFKHEEFKMLGGMFGGHVVLQVGDFAYGLNFRSEHVHTFARQRKTKMAGIFEKDPAGEMIGRWRSDARVTTIAIPLAAADFDSLRSRCERTHSGLDFDYAFFGMRCASTCYYMLGTAGVTHCRTRLQSIRKAFHPKQLRKKLLRLAKKRNYAVQTSPGSEKRKWEGG